MTKKIFVNLPAKDLSKSMAFSAQLGFSFNPQFTDEITASMIVSDDIYVMPLAEAKIREFTPKPICDATKCSEVLARLSCESREEPEALA